MTRQTSPYPWNRSRAARDLLEWNGVLPTLRIVLTSDEDAVTPTFSVIADYGWAERILCLGCHRNDAETIRAALEEAMGR